jgi:hypothetical protein
VLLVGPRSTKGQSITAMAATFEALVVAYIIGGLTFVPVVLATLLAFVFYTSPVVDPKYVARPAARVEPETEEEQPKLFRSGWLTVRRTYQPLALNDGTYIGMLSSGYRSFMDNRSRDPRRMKPRDRFFAVLKQQVLFLYDNEEQRDCWAAIEVSAHHVLIHPEGEFDGELFSRRNALCLKPRSLSSVVDSPPEEGTTDSLETGRPLPWFLFAHTNSDKEDWYHALVHATKLAESPSQQAPSTIALDRSVFDPADMARLVQGIDKQPDPIPMRWFNAILGRIFLAIYRTEALEAYVMQRITRKLDRIRKPSFLSNIKVREVNVGSTTPFFSRPMLKELTADGDASMETDVSYTSGDLRITIEAVATINLGQRFKSYSVSLVLAVVLKQLDGTLLLKIKKPPSNRLWFAFTTMPKMVLSVEPVVSTRQIKWSMISKPIESQLRQIVSLPGLLESLPVSLRRGQIAESVVMPHMDDLVFFDSRPYSQRGGIWGDALRSTDILVEPKPHDTTTTAEGEETVGGVADQLDDQIEALSTAVEPENIDPGLRRRHKASRSVSQPENLNQARETRAVEAVDIALSSDGTTIVPTSDKRNASYSSLSGASDQELGTSATSVKGRAKRKSWFSSSPKPQSSTGPDERPFSAPTTAPSSPSPGSKLFGKSSGANGIDNERVLESENETAASAAAKVREALEIARSNPAEAPIVVVPGNDLSVSQELDTTVPTIDHLSGSPSTSLTLSNSSTEGVAVESTSSSNVSSTSSSTPSLPEQRESPTQRREFPPPPRRTHQSTVSMDSGSPSSVINAWRSRPTDRQAIAASVNQARDTMKRWGTNWNSVRKTEGTGAAAGALFSRERREEILTSGKSPSRPRTPLGSLNDDGEMGDLMDEAHGGAMLSSDDVTPKATTGGDPAPIPVLPTMPTAVHPRPDEGYERGRRTSLSSSPRPRGIFSPPPSAPTTGLNKSTAPYSQSHSMSAPSEPVPIAALSSDLGSVVGMVPRSSSPLNTQEAVVTERVGYQPKPTMSIPGISDASHRFAMGSEVVNSAGSKTPPPPKASSLMNNFLRRSSATTTIATTTTATTIASLPTAPRESPESRGKEEKAKETRDDVRVAAAASDWPSIPGMESEDSERVDDRLEVVEEPQTTQGMLLA